MSGHSKWATIHRQKEVKDKVRGKLFSKLAAAISAAAKTGGVDPDSNFKLRMAIDKARESNMPKENIERAISKAGDSASLEEVVYEGFGPLGINVIIEALTDNRNRTGQEIKNIVEKGGGRMGQPGSVSFNFEQVGYILVKKDENNADQALALIDLGVNDIEESEGGIECYVGPRELYEVKKKIEASGFTVIETELAMKPKNMQKIDENQQEKVVKFLEDIEDQDDVARVFTNVEAS